MKRLLLSIYFLLSTLVLFGQSEIKFDFIKKKFKQNGVNFKKDTRLVIKCDNSAKLKFSLDTENKSFEITTPDILKPIFMSGSDKSGLTDGKDINNINGCLIRLNRIVKLGNDLYITNGNLSDFRREATYNINKIIKLYDSLEVPNRPKDTLRINYAFEKEQIYKTSTDYINDQNVIKQLIKLVSQDFNYIENTNRALIKATEHPNGYLQYIQQLNAIETSDYKNSMNSLNFLVNSLEASDEIKSEKFRSTKDLLSLSAAFLHPISKDTIYKLKKDLYSKNKFQFSFSSGIFYNQIVDSKYYIKANPDTTSSNNFIGTEDTDDFDLAFGALAHCSYRLTAGFGVGLNVGAALSPFDAKTRYLIGGSILFGRKNQFILNSGVSFARKEFLSDLNDKDAMQIPKSLTTVPTFSRIDQSLYFGITYNIIKIK
jgi:hypothetical protein